MILCFSRCLIQQFLSFSHVPWCTLCKPNMGSVLFCLHTCLCACICVHSNVCQGTKQCLPGAVHKERCVQSFTLCSRVPQVHNYQAAHSPLAQSLHLQSLPAGFHLPKCTAVGHFHRLENRTVVDPSMTCRWHCCHAHCWISETTVDNDS